MTAGKKFGRFYRFEVDKSQDGSRASEQIKTALFEGFGAAIAGGAAAALTAQLHSPGVEALWFSGAATVGAVLAAKLLAVEADDRMGNTAEGIALEAMRQGIAAGLAGGLGAALTDQYLPLASEKSALIAGPASFASVLVAERDAEPVEATREALIAGFISAVAWAIASSFTVPYDVDVLSGAEMDAVVNQGVKVNVVLLDQVLEGFIKDSIKASVKGALIGVSMGIAHGIADSHHKHNSQPQPAPSPASKSLVWQPRRARRGSRGGILATAHSTQPRPTPHKVPQAHSIARSRYAFSQVNGTANGDMW